MQNNNNMNLLGFKDVIFDSFCEDKEFVHIHASVTKMDTCPHCGSKKVWVHDHRIQKNLPTKLRKYFKRSKSLLTKPAAKLTSEQAKEVTLMLDLNNDLKLAYRLKELFYQYVLSQPNRVRASKSLREWIRRAEESDLKEFKSCITAFNNWFDEICNSFDYLGLMVHLKVLILR
ncbi:hypothetical protein HKO22_05850 [Peptoniphilus sp. AGMB00490]|uniref:Transposase IS204/IS1001/IS1096/IS1165 DDE domain-containing protein n=1 Tax=Peptoniphilus faecalis TaxID=2731255 RepID=A0A848RIL9_9FIRM|nr:transposase [Peptoniphilus faecalis]NMW85259.1 hypothetical protein [Peptoniphilus faecalis]